MAVPQYSFPRDLNRASMLPEAACRTESGVVSNGVGAAKMVVGAIASRSEVNVRCMMIV